ncbi:MAG: hypothetical protein WCS37_11315 [Chloroflexota bacterium]|nr:hypothetical protein [Chloroflexota bacterium]
MRTRANDSPDTIIITRPQTPYLCLGYHDVYDAVLDRAECERQRWKRNSNMYLSKTGSNNLSQ